MLNLSPDKFGAAPRISHENIDPPTFNPEATSSQRRTNNTSQRIYDPSDASAIPSNMPEGIFEKEEHPAPTAKSFFAGTNLLQKIDRDRLAPYRTNNIFYPFADREEWELVSWMIKSSLSNRQIDSFLHLRFVSVI